VVVVVVGAAVAAVDVGADCDDSQRTKQTVKAKKRMMEDRAILALTAQRADVYAENRVTVVAAVDLAGAGAGGVAAAAVGGGGGDVVLGPMDADFRALYRRQL
jgi:hypothetical protein